MIAVYFYSLIGVLLVSLVSLAGVFTLSLKEEFLRKYILIFVSLAIGALLGDVFFHIVPEAFESALDEITVASLIILGMLAFFSLEKFIHWHHHGEGRDVPHVHPVGKLVLFSDGMHNFIDGVIIGASFMVSLPIGFATTLAVILHEIPQEIGDFTVLLHAGYARAKALWFNFLSALTAVLGVLLVFLLGQMGESFVLWALPIIAGGFIYIALADLVPELHKVKVTKNFIVQILSIVIGVGAMFLLTFLE